MLSQLTNDPVSGKDASRSEVRMEAITVIACFRAPLCVLLPVPFELTGDLGTEV